MPYWSLTTPLRPVYAGIFPRFNVNELESRLSRLPAHLATQLHPDNLITQAHISDWSWLDSYFTLPHVRRQRLLFEVLEAAGFSTDTLNAINRNPRHEYVPQDCAHLAYLNWSVPLAPGSCLSSPGIVALMCEMVPSDAEGTGVEIGGGSGYHAAVLITKCQAIYIHAYEAIKRVADEARARLARKNMTRISVHPYAFTADHVVPSNLAFVYHTAIARTGLFPNAAQALREGGLYIAPRPLSNPEYSAKPTDMDLSAKHKTYTDYLAKGTSAACVLSSWIKHGSILTQATSLYGVTFVPNIEATSFNKAVAKNRVLTQLIAAYNQRTLSDGP